VLFEELRFYICLLRLFLMDDGWKFLLVGKILVVLY